jgi:AraC-like DNA-binding protein
LPSNYLRVFKDFLIKEYGSVDRKHCELISKLISTNVAVDGLIELNQFTQAHVTMVNDVNDPAIGIKYGRYLSSSDHGPLGALSTVCLNIIEFLEAQSNYLEIRTATKLDIVKQDKHYKVILEHAPALKDIIKFQSHVCITHFIHTLQTECGHACLDAEIGFPFSSKINYADYFDQRVKCGQQECYILLPEQYALLPLIHGDPATKIIFEKLCEDIRERVRSGNTIKNSILSLFDSCDNYPSFEFVASKFHMTTRTLSNKLAKENTSYRETVTEHRMNSAKQNLATTNMTIEKISEKNGYSSVGNFSRAFKNKFGISPSDYREEIRDS